MTISRVDDGFEPAAYRGQQQVPAVCRIRLTRVGGPLPSWALDTVSLNTPPGLRPLQRFSDPALRRQLEASMAAGDGLLGAHCIHELCMRGAMAVHIERYLAGLWASAAAGIPDWLPMRYIEWLPMLYEVVLRFRAAATGRSNIYLVLLDYSDSRPEPYGLYVGMSRYSPALRFDQHKAGIRAAGSVLKRGVEVLTGPTLHLQHIRRSEAARIEIELAEALTGAGLFVKGGH